MIKSFFVLIGVLFSIQIFAQTGIGTTTPHASAKLEVASTTMGFLPPRMTSVQRLAISNPAEGLMVYQTDGTSGLYYRGANGWIYIINSSNNVLPVLNGGTGVTTSTGSGNTVLSNSPELQTPIISSGSTQFPSSIFVTPTTFASSKRASLWLDNWALLQDFNGDGTRNFSITQNFSSTYPTRFFINTNGNVGIGNSSPGATLEIGSSNGSVPGSLVLNPTTTGTGVEGAEINLRPAPNPTTPTAQTWVIDQVSDANNPRLRIFPSIGGETRGFSVLDIGNLGIGTANPTSKLNLVGGGIKIHNGFSRNTARPALNKASIGNYEIRGVGSGGLNSQSDASDDGFLRISAGGGTNNNTQSSIDLSGGSDDLEMNNNIVIRTTGLERLRINSFGNVGIGTSSPIANLHVKSSDHTSVYIESTTTDNYGLIRLNANTSQNWTDNWHELVVFEKQGIQIGKIFGSSNGSQVTYGTNSDYRLKKEFQDFNALDIVSRLKAYNYAWKSDNSRMYGFIAHELQNELPYAVSGKKNQVDKNGNIQPQTVDYGKLTPILLKAIQEQDLKINEQQKQIETLMKRLEIVESKK